MLEAINRIEDLERRLAAIDRDLLYERAIHDTSPSERGRAIIASLEQQRVLVVQALRSTRGAVARTSAGVRHLPPIPPASSPFASQNPPGWAWIAIPAILFFASLIYLAVPSVPPEPSLPAVVATATPVPSVSATSTYVVIRRPTATPMAPVISTIPPHSPTITATPRPLPPSAVAVVTPTADLPATVVAQAASGTSTALAHLSESATQTAIAQPTAAAQETAKVAAAIGTALAQQQAQASATARVLQAASATTAAGVAGATATSVAAHTPLTPLPLIGDCDPNGSKDGQVTPPGGPAGTNFKAALYGFTPGEPVTYWYTSPTGQIYRLNVTLPISGAGTTQVTITTKGLQPGRWTLTVHGVRSNHDSIVVYCILP